MVTEEHEEHEEHEEDEHDTKSLYHTERIGKIDEKFDEESISRKQSVNFNLEELNASSKAFTSTNRINNKIHPFLDNEFEDVKDENDVNDENNDKLTTEETVQMCISALFMLLVGMSMPSIIKSDTESDTAHRSLRMLAEAVPNSNPRIPNDAITPIMYAVHILVCSFLLILGKMFPTFC